MHTGKFQKIARWTTNIAHLGAQRFAEMPFPLPPLPEQRRIVAEIEKQFTRLEAGVAALRRVQANLKRYRAAVLKAACEGRLVPTEADLARQRDLEGSTSTGDIDSPSHSSNPQPRKRGSIPRGRNGVQEVVSSDLTNPTTYETGEQLLARILVERRKRYKSRGKYCEPVEPDTIVLPELPEGWTWSSLDQLLGLMRNGISAKPDAKSGLPILRISAVRALSVDINEARFLNAVASDYPEYSLTEADLLFTRYSGNPELVGVCGVVPSLTSPLVHPDKLIRCKLVPSGALSDFVAIMANVGASRGYLAKRVRTTAGQAGISGGDLKGLPIPLAPLAEQKRIVAEVERRLSVVDELESVVKANLQRSIRLRQSILKQAFSSP
jgi:type I restriction enzyme S subunit